MNLIPFDYSGAFKEVQKKAREEAEIKTKKKEEEEKERKRQEEEKRVIETKKFKAELQNAKCELQKELMEKKLSFGCEVIFTYLIKDEVEKILMQLLVAEPDLHSFMRIETSIDEEDKDCCVFNRLEDTTPVHLFSFSRMIIWKKYDVTFSYRLI